MNFSACWRRQEGELSPLLQHQPSWRQGPHPGPPSDPAVAQEPRDAIVPRHGTAEWPPSPRRGSEGRGPGRQHPQRAGAPRWYLRAEAAEAQKGRVVPARAEGSVVPALAAAPVAQHEVRGGGEVENGGQVHAGVGEPRLPRADALDQRAVVRRGHDQLVLPAGPRGGGTRARGHGREAVPASAGVGRATAGAAEPRGCRAAGLRSPGGLRATGDGAQGKHGRPLRRGDVAGAAAADALGARGVCRGTAGE